MHGPGPGSIAESAGPDGWRAAGEPGSFGSSPGGSPRTAPPEATIYVAGFWRRAGAGLIDLAIVLPVAALLTWIVGRVVGLRLPPSRHGGPDYWLDTALAGDPALWGGLALAATIGCLYLFVLQVVEGRTFGMRVLELRVVDVFGARPSAGRAALRALGYVVSAGTLGLGFAWIGFDREKRGLHDWLAGTYVVRGRG